MIVISRIGTAHGLGRSRSGATCIGQDQQIRLDDKHRGTILRNLHCTTGAQTTRPRKGESDGAQQIVEALLACLRSVYLKRGTYSTAIDKQWRPHRARSRKGRCQFVHLSSSDQHSGRLCSWPAQPTRPKATVRMREDHRVQSLHASNRQEINRAWHFQRLQKTIAVWSIILNWEPLNSHVTKIHVIISQLGRKGGHCA